MNEKDTKQLKSDRHGSNIYNKKISDMWNNNIINNLILKGKIYKQSYVKE